MKAKLIFSLAAIFTLNIAFAQTTQNASNSGGLVNANDYWVMCVGGFPPPSGQLTTASATGDTNGANVVAMLRCWFPGGIVNKITFEVTTASGTHNSSFGLVNSAGTLVLSTGQLCDTSTPSMNTTGAKIITSSSTNCGSASVGIGSYLQPGYYYLAQTGDDTTLKLRSIAPSANFTTLFNAVIINSGHTASGSTSGVLPVNPTTPPSSGDTGAFVYMILSH